ALGIGPRSTQGDGTRRALIGIAQVDDDLGVMILTAPWPWPGTPATAGLAGLAGLAGGSLPEQVGEKLAEVAHVGSGEAAAGKLEAGVPIRRRLELLTVPVAA